MRGAEGDQCGQAGRKTAGSPAEACSRLAAVKTGCACPKLSAADDRRVEADSGGRDVVLKRFLQIQVTEAGEEIDTALLGANDVVDAIDLRPPQLAGRRDDRIAGKPSQTDGAALGNGDEEGVLQAVRILKRQCQDRCAGRIRRALTEATRCSSKNPRPSTPKTASSPNQ